LSLNGPPEFVFPLVKAVDWDYWLVSVHDLAALSLKKRNIPSGHP
jgi:hypothetical protein